MLKFLGAKHGKTLEILVRNALASGEGLDKPVQTRSLVRAIVASM